MSALVQAWSLRRRARYRAACFCAALLAAGGLQADAGRGELGGHRLGERVALDLVSTSKTLPDGSLRIAAPVADDEFDALYLYAAPRSGEVGKVALVRRLPTRDEAVSAARTTVEKIESRYADWERLRAPLPLGKTGGELLSRLQRGRYALIVFYRPLEQAGYEVVLELEYAAGEPRRSQWRDRVRAERE